MAKCEWTIEKCCCGYPNCRDYWVSSGKFVQGSGFCLEDAQLVSAAPELLSACEAIANGMHQSGGPVPYFLQGAINKAKGISE